MESVITHDNTQHSRHIKLYAVRNLVWKMIIQYGGYVVCYHE